jgi:hypothetical protein
MEYSQTLHAVPAVTGFVGATKTEVVSCASACVAHATSAKTKKKIHLDRFWRIIVTMEVPFIAATVIRAQILSSRLAM